jgi:hypothetical protein
LLLSPVYRLVGLNFQVLKALVNSFFILSLPMVFLIFRKRLPFYQSLLLMLILAVNPAFFAYKDYIGSDVPFVFFALASVFFIQKTVVERSPAFDKPALYCILGLAMFFAYYVRFQGVVLPVVLLACQYIDARRLKQSVATYVRSHKRGFIPYVAFVALGLVLRAILPTGTGTYLHALLSNLSVREAITNIHSYIVVPADFFGPFTLSAVVYGITLPFAALGVIKNFKADYLYLIFPGITLALLVPYPYPQGIRCSYAFFPFYIYFTLAGLTVSVDGLVNSKYLRFKGILIGAFGLFLIGVSAMALASVQFRSGLRADKPGVSGIYAPEVSESGEAVEGPYTGDGQAMLKYIETETSRDDVIIFTMPRVITLYTDRPAAAVVGFDRVIAAGAKYVVRSKKLPDGCHIDSLVREHGGNLELVFENKGFAIYRVVTAASVLRG